MQDICEMQDLYSTKRAIIGNTVFNEGPIISKVMPAKELSSVLCKMDF